MIKKSLLLSNILLITATSCKKQIPTNILIENMCQELNSDEIEDNETAILDYFETYCDKNNVSEDRRSEVVAQLIKNCDFFAKSVTSKPNKDADWEHFLVKPKSLLKNDLIQQFTNEKMLFYYDAEKKIVKVEITSKIWYEKMHDNTFSKLAFNSNKKNQFYLEFIESNNDLKKHLSKAGDKYFYEIINYNNGNYIISTHFPERGDYFTFTLYSSPLMDK